jgi:hypothetical protein
MTRPTVRELVGFTVVAAGVACLPLGWIAGAGWLVAGAALILLGGFLYLTRRVSDALADPGGAAPDSPGAKADIHNYSGWRTGGRRPDNPLDSSSSSDAAGADGD